MIYLKLVRPTPPVPVDMELDVAANVARRPYDSLVFSINDSEIRRVVELSVGDLNAIYVDDKTMSTFNVFG